MLAGCRSRSSPPESDGVLGAPRGQRLTREVAAPVVGARVSAASPIRPERRYSAPRSWRPCRLIGQAYDSLSAYACRVVLSLFSAYLAYLARHIDARVGHADYAARPGQRPSVVPGTTFRCGRALGHGTRTRALHRNICIHDAHLVYRSTQHLLAATGPSTRVRCRGIATRISEADTRH